MMAGELAVCLPFLLEAGYSTRSMSDRAELMRNLTKLPRVAIDADVERLALQAQHELTAVGHHRVAPGLGGASWETKDLNRAVPGLRSQVTSLCEMLAAGGTGLLISVDELHRSLFDELAQLCAIVQHAFREELELFLIQLVGFRTWRQHPEREQIEVEDARAGIEEARRRLGSLVHGPAVHACSDIDKTFLLAMARDDGPSRISDIAKRLEAK